MIVKLEGNRLRFNMDLQFSIPEEEGISSARLNLISEVIQDYIEQNRIPGAAWLVSRNDRIVQMAALGFRDIEAKEVVEIDTIFRIASMTKPVT